jgi:hypothetical protein
LMIRQAMSSIGRLASSGETCVRRNCTSPNETHPRYVKDRSTRTAVSSSAFDSMIKV